MTEFGDTRRAWSATLQEQRTPGLGASDIATAADGGCWRRAAYRLNDVPVTDVVDTGAADMGTIIHAWWSSVISAKPFRDADVPVRLPGLEHVSEADDVDWGARIVTDLKTVGPNRYDALVSRPTPPEGWHRQVNLYGYGVHLLLARERRHRGATDPESGWSTRVIMVDRATGRDHEWPAAPLDLGQAADDLDYLVEQEMMLRGRDPVDTPPVPSGLCGYCAWKSACDAAPAPEPTLVDLLPPDKAVQVHEALHLYVEAAAAIRDAKARQEQAKPVLLGVVGVMDGWSITRTREGVRTTVDREAAELLLAQYGEELPVTTTVTPSYLRVSRVRG